MNDFYSQNRCVCSTRSHGPLLCAFCLSFHFKNKVSHKEAFKLTAHPQLGGYNSVYVFRRNRSSHSFLINLTSINIGRIYGSVQRRHRSSKPLNQPIRNK